MATLQEVIQQAVSLPIAEQRTLAEFLLEQARQDAQRTGSPVEPPAALIPERPDMVREREREWLRQHWREYLGQWVALEGDRLISSGEDARQVFAAARAAGLSVPFVVHVQDPTLPQMGGW
ncbi:MAG: DUF5678 domain-containing protein [Blastocatellia bacterium]